MLYEVITEDVRRERVLAQQPRPLDARLMPDGEPSVPAVDQSVLAEGPETPAGMPLSEPVPGS